MNSARLLSHMRWLLNFNFVILAVVAGSLARAEPTPGTDNLVQLNTVGYRPELRKLGTATAKAEKFVVRDIQTGRPVMEGAGTKVVSSSTSQPLYRIDFSAVKHEGIYRIEFEGGSSSEFRIEAAVYNWPFYCVMRGMYLGRCGAPVSEIIDGNQFEHGACHLDDAYLDFVGGPVDKRKDGSGGWHDAGDYNKYSVNAAFTLGLMLTCWEHFQQKLTTLKLDIPESGNQIPDFLDEAKWEFDWLLKMQAGDGSVYHKLSTRNFGGFIRPDKETERRYFSPWSSAATANFVAVMAQSSRVYQQFDKKFSDECLAAAKKSYAFLQSHPEDHHPDVSAFQTGGYDAPDPDDRLWAAAELWETTGDASALRDCEARITANKKASAATALTVDFDWDWSNLRNLAAFTYLRSTRAGRNPAIVARVRGDALRIADEIVAWADRHPYGRPLGDTYHWGCNGTVARQTMNLNVAYELTNDRRYRDAMLDALNHLFGRNPYGRSYVTGLGKRPPLFPHDRRTGGDKVAMPWPGYLVGGPWPRPRDWVDSQDSYQTNEIAINWNGSLVYALAAFVEPDRFNQSIKDKRDRMNGHSGKKP
jgi:endoglucanase